MMQQIIIPLIVILFMTTLKVANAQTPTFDMTFDDLRLALDAQIRKDTLDRNNVDNSTIDKCRKITTGFECRFHDKGYQQMVRKFKELNLANGNFE